MGLLLVVQEGSGLYFVSYMRGNAWEGHAKVEVGLPSRRVH